MVILFKHSFVSACRFAMGSVGAGLLKGLRRVLEQQRNSVGGSFSILIHYD